jgi:release factor glutamine methyltransferase
LAICAEVKNLHIIAVDCSKDVLEVAERNMERHKSLLSPRNNLIELVESNLFSKINPTEKLDFIISNPPYIPSKNISSLQVDITQYEPLIALDGGPDGLSFYRYLLETAPSLLTPEGGMFLEIGFDQQANLNLLLKEFPDWKTSVFQPDLQGNDRVWELGLS